MRLFRNLSELIDRKLTGVRDYAELAILIREKYPGMSANLYNISKTEEEHAQMLGDILAEYMSTRDTSPEYMALYTYTSDRLADKLEEAKKMRELYEVDYEQK